MGLEVNETFEGNHGIRLFSSWIAASDLMRGKSVRHASRSQSLDPCTKKTERFDYSAYLLTGAELGWGFINNIPHRRSIIVLPKTRANIDESPETANGGDASQNIFLSEVLADRPIGDVLQTRKTPCCDIFQSRDEGGGIGYKRNYSREQECPR
jgi:hypothetical protein